MAFDKRTRQKLELELAVLLKKGRLERAALVLRTILEKDPGDDRLFVKLAEVCQKLGDEAGVRAAFRGAAEAAERKGFYLRAMAALRQLARYLPAPERPWNELSDLAFRLGLTADALGFLDEGARAWSEAGDRAAVLQAARRAHTLAPDDGPRTLRLTLELRTAGHQAEALSLLSAEAARHQAAGRQATWLLLADEQASLDPTNRALACRVANAHLDQGEPRRALQRLQALMRERAQHAESLRLLVRTFEALGQPAKRLAAVRELARTLTSRGREEEAGALWRELLDADVADVEARRALGMGALPTRAPVVARVAAAPPATASVPPAPAPPPPPAEEPGELRSRRQLLPQVQPSLRQALPVAAAPADGAADPAGPDLAEELIDLEGAGVEVEEAFATPTRPPQAPDPISATPAPRPAVFASTPPPGSSLLAPIDISLLELPPEGPEEAHQAAAAALADLEDDLAHAAFLVAHRFTDEASLLLATLAEASPGHLGVAALQAQLAAGPQRIPAHLAAPGTGAGPGAGPAAPSGPAGDPREEVHDADLLGAVELVSAEEVLAQFREQVALTVSPEDAATHYDLGIAYREMGLLGEAQAEFELALTSAGPARAVDCLVGVALCEAGRGDPAKASRTLKRALALPAITPAGAAAVLYELGAIREQAGDAGGAAWSFQAAERSQPRFRDAAARASRLQPLEVAPLHAAALGPLTSGA